jgi:hypothetical protein
MFEKKFAGSSGAKPSSKKFPFFAFYFAAGFRYANS